ncbi:MAG: hypothetical protein AVDCRST_MAG73-792 [uncultured Thermomicrobiales bacterium]|uniref:Integral membrane protein n=1 Tax=uncultured Thermomicrobiales bacterium TaxID=1645740 RepID=A0A6J4TQK5_9BACT|nr:MAG: hypothetical protein AVDCRST_MAG73-792 [uncultured Thermomicrobiales bacterium]
MASGVVPEWVRAYRVAFALLGIAAVVTQLVRQIDRDASIANFFSFFTIQSNILAAAVLLWGATRDQERRDPATVDLLRGAAALYLSITGVVYGLLLSGYQEALQTTIPWVDTALHRVIPIVMVIDWLLVPPRTRLTLRRALIWLAYPALYAVYSWVRGGVVDWYPYPFLDPRNAGGWAAVAAYAAAITAGALLFAWLVVQSGNRLRLTTGRT